MPTRTRRKDARGPIDFREPLAEHDLNQGRVFWQLALPNRFGGPVAWDLVRGFPGTLNSGVSWKSTSRPACGQFTFNGSGEVDVTSVTSTANFIGAAFSLACWVKTTALAATLMSHISTLLGFSSWEWALGQGGIANAGIPSLYNGSNWVSGTTTVNDGAWHRLLMAHRLGGPTRFYVDGKLDASVAQGNVAATDGEFVVLGARGGGGLGLLGDADDFGIWNRSLSDADAALDYQLSQQGYPGVLRRRQRVAYSVAGVTTAVDEDEGVHYYPRYNW